MALIYSYPSLTVHQGTHRVGHRGTAEQRAEECEEGNHQDRLIGAHGPAGNHRGHHVGGIVKAVGEI